MSTIDEIINSLDLERLAANVGADPDAVEAAARQALPTLLMGLGANAADPAGAASIERALADHDPALVRGTVDPSQVDAEDGAKITHHIFGGNEGAVVDKLSGSLGIDSGLVRKLLPVLAPIVMAWLASKYDEARRQQPGTAQEQAPTTPTSSTQEQAQAPGTGGGLLGDILGQVLGGGQQSSGGGILLDVLGSLLGAGRR